MTDSDTPGRLIAAAERLIVEGGEEDTSLRAIARAAHANAAAVHYHFGGRDELLQAVSDRHLGPLALRRRELVEAAAARGLGVAALVEAAIRADVELLVRLRREKVDLARFLGRTALNQHGAGSVVGWCGVELFGDMLAALRSALPEHRASEVGERLRLAFAMVCALFATAPEPGEAGLVDVEGADDLLRRLATFVVGGLTAPSVRPPRQRASAKNRGTHEPAGARAVRGSTQEADADAEAEAGKGSKKRKKVNDGHVIKPGR